MTSIHFKVWFDPTRVVTRRVGIRTREVRIPQSPSTGGGRSTHSVTESGFSIFIYSYRCVYIYIYVYAQYGV